MSSQPHEIALGRPRRHNWALDPEHWPLGYRPDPQRPLQLARWSSEDAYRLNRKYARRRRKAVRSATGVRR